MFLMNVVTDSDVQILCTLNLIPMFIYDQYCKTVYRLLPFEELSLVDAVKLRPSI